MGLYLAGCTDMDIGGIRRAPSAGMERIYMMRDGSMRQLLALLDWWPLSRIDSANANDGNNGVLHAMEKL